MSARSSVITLLNLPAGNKIFRTVFAAVLVLLTSGTYAQDAVWSPQSPVPGARLTADWVQLDKGEWLKGEFLSLRDDVLLFDSEEFKEQSFSWDDIRELHTAEQVTVVLLGGQVIASKVSVVADTVALHDTGELVERSRILSVIPVHSGWWDLWDGRFALGWNLRSGNTNQSDLQLQIVTVNQTAFNRLSVSYLGNFSRVGSKSIANNSTAVFRWDYYLGGGRAYLIPAAYNFNNDRFRNIRQHHTMSIGFGYEILKLADYELDLTGGAGYQYLEHSSVAAGESPMDQNFILETAVFFGADLTSSTKLDIDYRLNLETFGQKSANQNVLATINVDITNDLELDLSFTWSRVGSPEPRSDGSIPEKNDFRLSSGIAYTF